MNQKYKRMIRSDFNYSHVGQASAKQFSYLLDKRTHLKNILKGKKHNKIIEDDFINQEEKDIYDDLYEKDEDEEDIFDKDYKNKYEQLLKEKKQKYFDLRKSCSFLFGDDKNKINENEKIFKRKLIDQFDNDKFKYHLIHHHHDYYLDKILMNINVGQPNCTSYNPKMEYIFKKIIYTPQFKKMSGRYDQENLKNKIEHKVEISKKHIKEKDLKLYQIKKEKARESLQIEKKEKINNVKKTNTERLDNPIRHYTIMNKRNNSMVSLFKKVSAEKLDENNNEELINESKNFNKKLFKRTNTMINRGPNLISFTSNKNILSNIKNIEENENEEDNYEYEEKMKNNISNNIDGNTLSSANYNKTTSGKKKDSSIYYNNNETDIIYPNNLSKNDSNILISNNYSYKNGKEEKNNYRNRDNNLTSNNNSTSFNENNSSKKFTIINKNSKNTSNIITKQNILPSINTNIKVVNFEKMLSREYVRKLNERKVNIYSTLTPNYKCINPKLIMKVMYANKKIERKNKIKEFKSLFNEFVFDINKNYNNYNNHIAPKYFYLDKFTGRDLDNNSPLPSYMVKQYNRNAFNTFNDKSLEMNNFSNSNLKILKSSFNDKKSFNYKLNDQYFDNDNNNNEINSILVKINKLGLNKKLYENRSHSTSDIISNKYRIFENGSLFKPKISEYYKLNLDQIEKYPYSNGEKIDGFTLKTIKSNKSAIDLLTDYEKRIFLSKLDN